jgi:hypothetical protein
MAALKKYGDRLPKDRNLKTNDLIFVAKSLESISNSEYLRVGGCENLLEPDEIALFKDLVSP